ncbi:hypothetical protein C1645_762833 [Glomus cerebriforme]|uniref:PB1 domain-containing protein n=1 Tax=Glomus cerebriforme TaxID=658196 RepID=A0A397T4D6_9GLOM|nr:hypothetical protein C1645_762833 [Glomus cerebriforme]
MEEYEETYFITKPPEPPSYSSTPLPTVGPSYIRNWQTEGACAQLYLSKLQFSEFKEHSNNNNNECSNNSICRYSPPKFRYRYLKEGIVLYLLNNGQIFIPLQALSRIEKGKNKEVKLILKEDKKKLIEYCWNDNYTHGKKVVIKENMRASQHILLKFHKDVPIKEIDIVGLHIDYLINKNNLRTSLGSDGEIVPQSSWNSSWGLLKNDNPEIFIKSNNDNEELVIKFHIHDEIRIFLFNNSLQFQEIKEHIEEACNLPIIRKLKYKDDDDEFITISSQDEFKIALTLYSKNNKLEMWYF